MLRISSVIPLFILILINAKCVNGAAGQNAPAQASINSQKTPPALGQVSGHIYRSDTGAPIAKAEVALIPVKINPDVREDPRFFTITDADGAYTFSKVGPGTYSVVANHAGFVSRDIDPDRSFEDADRFNLASGQVLDKIDVRLVPAGVIAGTVTEEDNQPLAAVMVEAVRLRYARGGRQLESPQLRVWTDDLGNFRLYGLPQGNYFVRVEITNVSPQTGKLASRLAYYPGTTEVENAQPLKVTPGNEISGIRLSIGPLLVYSITGNVIDPTGLVGQGRYTVTAMNATDAANGMGRITRATSGANGSFTVRGLPPGTYEVGTILLGADSDRPSRRSVSGFAKVRVSDSDVRANIQVSVDAEVSGRISIENSTGQSVSGISIALWPQNISNYISDFGRNPLKSVTDQHGNFKITYVSSGNYDFAMLPVAGIYLKQIVCNGKDHTLLPLTIEGGASVNDCVLTMGTDAGVVKGQVLDGDKPVSGRTVVAIPEDRSLRRLERFTITGITNANGEYQLSGVIAGDYLLFAVPLDDDETYFDVDFADRNQRDAERVTVKHGDTRIVPLKPAAPQ